jgi:hypothetical protein
MSKKDDSAAYGMDLRDYFAAAAMQGILAGHQDGAHPNIYSLARDAYRVADAMLKERVEKP